MSDVAGSNSGKYRALPVVWLFSLGAAESEREVVTAVRDYLATWQPAELSQLPESCRPPKITSGEDISDFAFKLSHAQLELEFTEEGRRLFDRLMSFFVSASDRVSQLASRRAPEIEE